MLNTATAGRTWDFYAHARGSTYWFVGAKPWVELHGLTDPVVPVIAEEWLGDVRDPEVTHYGWEYTGKPGSVTMIWPRARGREDLTPWLSLGMCFPYGMQAEIEAGKGQMVALRIAQKASDDRGAP